MWTHQFDPKSRIILVPVQVQGPLGDVDLKFLVDTGTPVTIVNTAFADLLGCNAKTAKRRSRLWGTGGPQDGYVHDVVKLTMMGVVIEPCELAFHDLDEELGIDGLIGMDLLEGRTLTIDGKAGFVTLVP